MLAHCSFDEHAGKDLPAMLNYVMKTTGQTELFYVGHSQGTVMGFAGFTVNQTLAKHIKSFFALAPVTTVKHIEGLFAFISEKLVIESLEVCADCELPYMVKCCGRARMSPPSPGTCTVVHTCNSSQPKSIL